MPSSRLLRQLLHKLQNLALIIAHDCPTLIPIHHHGPLKRITALLQFSQRIARTARPLDQGSRLPIPQIVQYTLHLVWRRISFRDLELEWFSRDGVVLRRVVCSLVFGGGLLRVRRGGFEEIDNPDGGGQGRFVEDGQDVEMGADAEHVGLELFDAEVAEYSHSTVRDLVSSACLLDERCRCRQCELLVEGKLEL
jgi:hypothetical protein